MALRTCLDCGKEAFNVEDLGKFKKGKTSKHGRENICNRCNNIRYGFGPEYHREYDKKRYERNSDLVKKINQKRFRFHGERVYPAENPRTNICYECGQSYPDELKKQTCLHHIKYDPSNPLSWTVDLCTSCHMKLHKVLRRMELRGNIKLEVPMRGDRK